jgi:hypothetical protein
MATRTHTGTCQCGRVRYEAEIDLGAVAARGHDPREPWTVLIRPTAFRLLSGWSDLADDQFGTLIGLNQSCRYCGIRPFGKGHLKSLGGDLYAVNLATLDYIESRGAFDAVGEQQAAPP